MILMKRSCTNPRRGIVLITVVSLLVLFMLLGVTYTIIASQAQKASEGQARSYFQREDPQRQLDRTMYQLVTDTRSSSSIAGHGLLRDLYGNEGVIGKIAVDRSSYPNSNFFPGTNGDRNPIALAGGHFIEFHFRAERPKDTTLHAFYDHPEFRATPPFGNRFIQEDHAYNGCVFTFLSGPWSGYSTHIVAYRFHRGDNGWGEQGTDDDQDSFTDEADEAGWPGTNDIIRIRIPLPGPDFDNIVTSLDQLIGSRFLINGQPFNGTGVGFAPGTGNLDLAVWEKGPDGAWGDAQTDDDGDGITDEPDEAGANGTDDILVPYAALLPHYARYDSQVEDPASGLVRPMAMGGSDESYDAVDYQNMALAMVPANATVGVVPSFHRPALVNFWLNHGLNTANNPPTVTSGPNSLALAANNAGYRDFRRKFVMRPMPWDHPQFTGSNVLFAARDTNTDNSIWDPGPDGAWGVSGTDDDLDGLTDEPDEAGAPGSDDVLDNDSALLTALSNLQTAWDVDNDGDGVRDSVWLDVGFPVRTAANGKQYKPLVAILVKDLDGRLNINTADNLARLDARFQDGAGNLGRVPFTGAMAFAGAAPTSLPTAAQPNAYLWRGLGFGPAEITLRPVVGNVNDYQRLVRGRYGMDGEAVSDALAYSATAAPGNKTLDDAISQIQSIGMPRLILKENFNNSYTGYGSRPDILGVSAWAIDYFGQPVNRYAGQDYTLNQTFNDPYEIDLTRGGNGTDAPYTMAELERLLRSNDGDATTLPNRILQLASSVASNWPNKEQVTTDSWSIPSVHAWMLQDPVYASFIGVGSGMDNASTNNAQRVDDVLRVPSLIQLYRELLRRGMGSGTPPQALENELNEIAPWELMQGKPFDINRLWGNGVDDDQDGIVDEPYERDQRDFQGNATVTSERWEPNGVDEDGAGGIDDAAGEFGSGAEEYVLQGTNTYLDGAVMDHTNIGRLARAAAANNPAAFPYVQRFPPDGTGIDDLPYQSNQRVYPRIGREIFARHLYCMLMLVKGFRAAGGVGAANHKFIDFDGDPSNDSIQETARGLAQYAINVVDFRDPDVIMTAFEYDVNPFNGWSVDGNPNTNEGGERAVVFGCERPELLLTETIAWHDRRTEDRDDDRRGNMGQGQGQGARGTSTTDPNNPDDDFDQRFLPESGAYFELFNPWTSAADTVSATYKLPAEIYSSHINNGGQAEVRASSGVKLDRRTGINGSPVWRVLVLSDNSLGKDGDVWDTSDSNRTPFDDADVERRIYFTNVDNVSAGAFNDQLGAQNGKHYTSVNHLPPIRPGRYAVVGSSGRLLANGTDYVNMVGRREDVMLDSVVPGGGGPMNRNSTRRLIFRPDLNLSAAPTLANFNTAEANANVHQFRVTFNFRPEDPVNAGVQMTRNNMPTDPTDAATPTDILPVVGIPLNRTAENATRERSFSISEPVGGYSTLPNQGGPFQPVAPANDEEDSVLQPPRDKPLDRDRDVWFNGTRPYREFVLQRLANPTIIWNPMPGEPGHNTNLPVNPYMTVDRSTASLTSFNGLLDYVDYAGMATATSRNEPTVPDSNLNFRSHQRGDSGLDLANEYSTGMFPNPSARVLWRRDAGSWGTGPVPQRNHPEIDGPGMVRPGPAHRFGHEMIQTLGYLNHGYHPFFNTSTGSPSTAYRGAPSFQPMIEQPSGDQVPAAPPFPWLAWHNRPYANPLEIMQVPWTSSAQLMTRFDVRRTVTPTEPYALGLNDRINGRRFPHLLPFFQSVNDGSELATHLYRVFDLIETPSPFTGTKTWVNPNRASYNTLGTDFLRPPFNHVSQFRAPGQVNLNTIFGGTVWSGINKTFPYHDTTAFVTAVNRSRQGYSGATPAVNSAFPTLFANPFRSASSAHLAPNVPGLRKDNVTDTSATNAPIQATMLRSLPGTTNQPLFKYQNIVGHEYHNSDRNPVFRYHGLQRLSNLTTSKSNVFATWITMGYFEVVPSKYGATSAHPDGYVLGSEVGMNTGEVKRHRAFYVLDRSVPVAFEPGENHNVDRAILLRRYIE